MTSILLYLFIATKIWHVDMNWIAGAKVDSGKEKTYVLTSECEGKTPGEIHDLEKCVWNGSLSELQQIQANYDIVYHRASWAQPKGNFYGLKASLNVYRLPEVGAHQTSSTSIVMANVYDSSLRNFNAIEAGWHVVPALYGDREPHFFIYWKVAERNIGCFNLRCKGFVYMNSKTYTPGSRITPVSRYNGQQYEITVTISQDPDSGDWWVHVGRFSEVPVGYWPKALFVNMVEGAEFIQWGGAVSYPRGEKGPPMGNGHFPEEGSKKAAYVKDVMILTDTKGLPAPYNIQDKDDCYKVGSKSNQDYFGGPGGCID